MLRTVPGVRCCRQVWSFHYGKEQTVYIWKPVPPTNDFVSLGMLATKTEEPPSTEEVHCVVSQSDTTTSLAHHSLHPNNHRLTLCSVGQVAYEQPGSYQGRPVGSS